MNAVNASEWRWNHPAASETACIPIPMKYTTTQVAGAERKCMQPNTPKYEDHGPKDLRARTTTLCLALSFCASGCCV